MNSDVPGPNDAKLKTAKEYVRARSLELIQERERNTTAANRRRETRLIPAEYQFAIVSGDLANFARTGTLSDRERRYAIVLDVSDGGCSLVLELGPDHDPAFPQLNREYALKLDGREPRRGVVRWRSHISDALINAGFEFQS